VAGSAIFNAKSYAGVIAEMRAQLEAQRQARVEPSA
jgi:hypothetical protein